MFPLLSNRLLYLKHRENDVSTLFILEAPFDNEIKKDCPCVGCTGEIMSKALFGPSFKTPLGDILNRKARRIPINAEKYAVFDTFKFPIDPDVAQELGISCCDLWSPENSQWGKIKELDRSTGRKLNKQKEETGFYNRPYHYKTLIQYIQNIDSGVLEIFINDYKADLRHAIKTFENLKDIVICGFIAQSVFCFVYGMPYCIIPYRENFIVSEKRINIRFVNHPINVLKKRNHSLWQYKATNTDPIHLNMNATC